MDACQGGVFGTLGGGRDIGPALIHGQHGGWTGLVDGWS